jgi:UDP-N-acetylmuramate: L-alanyl-gamma-D-glutamyl-meso-diaminopimelate ligase
MHIHILGICGTFMGGIAALALEAGHRVTGCDANVYPPMSTQLRALGIELSEGYGADQLAIKPDVFVIGNTVTRGNELMEAILNAGAPYTSGPQWLQENVLKGRHVLAVAGTHGKTTTTSMLAWILEASGHKPGFLVGGVPQNFGVSARLGDVGVGKAFVVEADEYDTALFDKRSKFVHYRARTVILNNLEFDHADIFDDLADIERQFHHLVRTVPSEGRVICHYGQTGKVSDEALARVLAKGCWSELERFGAAGADWFAQGEPDDFAVMFKGENVGRVQWKISGVHNQHNALAAIAAARHIGVAPQAACDALTTFENVKRRMELRGEVRGVKVYDDFAHHPTAIATTIDGLRRQVGAQRIIAVFEPRSNTMKLGAMAVQLPAALQAANRVVCYTNSVGWDPAQVLAPLGARVSVASDIAQLVNDLATQAQAGDHLLIMSNGSFGGIHEKLLAALKNTAM